MYKTDKCECCKHRKGDMIERPCNASDNANRFGNTESFKIIQHPYVDKQDVQVMRTVTVRTVSVVEECDGFELEVKPDVILFKEY